MAAATRTLTSPGIVLVVKLMETSLNGEGAGRDCFRGGVSIWNVIECFMYMYQY
eukprot:m.205191 g.205191  ORF g.205191 m.205191 type:complete len:54 (-) comp17093_c0_seq4:32-193(-)